MNYKKLISVFISITISFYACKNGILKSDYTNISFTEEYTLSSETWIKIQIQAADKRSVLLYKNGDKIEQIYTDKLDTILHISNLSISTEYSFKLEVRGANNELIESNLLIINTLEITSSDITWRDQTFGQFGSIAHDINVTQDGKGLCVGYFTNGNENYNGITANNLDWEFIGIPVKIWGNDTAFAYTTLYNILYYSPNDIWVTTGGEFIHYNGVTWDKWQFLFENLSDPDFGRVRDVCVISNNNYMAVGDKGSLYRYDGSYWKRISSPTQNNLHSISAFSDSETEYVWYGGDNVFYYKKNNLEWINLSEDSILFDTDIARVTSIIHYDSNNLFLTIRKSAISFLYRLNPEDPSDVIEIFRTTTYCNKMTILDKNDIIFVNNSGNILHFNGQEVVELPKLNPGDHYYAVHSIDQNIYLAGDRTVNAIIISGTK